MPELTPEDIEIVQEEEALLSTIRDTILAAFKKRQSDNSEVSRRLEELRDEAAKAKPDDLPAIFDQMNTQRALMDRSSSESIPEPLCPYFAHLKLKEGGKTKDILLGHQTFLDRAKLPIIDWRHAPVSRIFFNYREGEEYEEELPGRLAEGVVLSRRVLTIERGRLVQITSGAKNLVLRDDKWTLAGRGLPVLTGGAGTASRSQQSIGTGQSGGPSADIAALLDPEQYRLLNSDIDDPLLILGGAGCGKTTVALHRMAFLNYQDKRRFSPKKMIVIVPEMGLVRLSRRLLDSLGLQDVEITTFEHWIGREARRMIRRLPKNIYPDTPGNVIKLKRHPALRIGFKALIAIQIDDIAKTMEKKLPGSEKAVSILLKRTDLAMIERLQLAERDYILHLPGDSQSKARKQRTNVVKQFFTKIRKEALNVADDRVDLFTNRNILELIQEESHGTITKDMINQVASYSVDQLGATTQQRYQNIDTEKLATIDGTSLQDQDELDVSGTIDSEDFAILLELYFLKRGKANEKGHIKTYNHIVIDEAQDLAPMERNVLGRALSPEAAITIAGDAAQQIDPAASFGSWENVLDELGVTRVQANHLTTTYRSSTQIAEFAHHVLGPLAPSRPPKSIKEGAPVSFTTFRNEGQLAMMLNESLTDLMTTEPHASVAIIAKEFDSAKKIYDVLRNLPKIRLVHDGDFEFRPGIEVTDASQVKGLEFDYVVIPDASFSVYHNKPEDRRLMHVAATRAIHQLWVISVVEPSSIIEAAVTN